MPFDPKSKPRDRIRWMALRVAGNASAVLSVYPNLEYTKMEGQAADDLLDLLDWLEKQDRQRIEAGGFVAD